jgi:hypothetical protein
VLLGKWNWWPSKLDVDEQAEAGVSPAGTPVTDDAAVTGDAL